MKNSIFLLMLLISCSSLAQTKGSSQQSLNRALVEAIESTDAVKVKRALAQGADPNTRIAPLPGESGDGHPVLTYAVLDNLWEGKGNQIFDAVMEKNPDVTARGTRGTTALMHAAGSDNLRAVEAILARIVDEKDITATSEDGVSALMWANDAPIIEALLARIKNPNVLRARDNDGLTALMYVVHCGDERAIQALLSRGLDPNAKDNDGKSVLYHAGPSRCGGLSGDFAALRAISNSSSFNACLIDFDQLSEIYFNLQAELRYLSEPRAREPQEAEREDKAKLVGADLMKRFDFAKSERGYREKCGDGSTASTSSQSRARGGNSSSNN